MDDARRAALRTRLRTARGHLDAVLRMVDEDAYCPDVMKQLSAVQGTLEAASRLTLRNHLETCVARAMQEGRTAAIVDELMETLKYDKATWRPALVPPDGDDPRAAPATTDPTPSTPRQDG